MAKTKKEKGSQVTASNKEPELTKTTGVDLQNPAFDPDIPEQKQRHFR